MIFYARSYSNCEMSIIIKRFLLGRHLSLYSTKKFWAESSSYFGRIFLGPNLLQLLHRAKSSLVRIFFHPKPTNPEHWSVALPTSQAPGCVSNGRQSQ